MLNETFECLYSITKWSMLVICAVFVPLHEQPESLIYISKHCTIQVHVCLTVFAGNLSYQ